MEGLNESNKDTKEGFFKYVFNFDEKNVNCLLNLFQYTFISVPLIVIVLKLMNYYTNEEDDSKGTLEILVEIVGSISLILMSIWFINKIIRYIPTYTKTDYPMFNEINFIIPLFIVLFTIQTKLGAKINIMVERFVDLYEGKTNLKEKEKEKQKSNDSKNSPPVHQNSQGDFLPPPQMQNMKGNLETQYNNSAHNNLPQQQQENFNGMYQGPPNPLVNAAEPMAANETMGGMWGSSF
jgi:hypothetical protein